MSSKTKRPRKGLSGQVETIQESTQSRSFDTEDEALLDHVDEFIRRFTSMSPLEELSLKTPEEAQRALAILSKNEAEVGRHLRTAKALKKMLTAKGASDTSEN